MITEITHIRLENSLGEFDAPHILVMGLGESGVAMARWSITQGARVSIHDTRSVEQLSQVARDSLAVMEKIGIEQITFGPALENVSLDQVDVIAMSPGLSPKEESVKTLLERAKQKNISLWGELDFFSKALVSLKVTRGYDPKVIAITGTNGKTTTTALTGVICAKAGKSVAIAGNISPSLLDKLNTCLVSQDLPEIWVLELSSYQLFYCDQFAPHAATILNISEDHLDWHGDMLHYTQAKAKIFGQDTIAVVNRDDAAVMGLFPIEETSRRRVISFGMDTPLVQDSFGIVGDMTGGGIDWLAWASPTEEYLSSLHTKKRKSKLSAEYDADPIQIKRLIPVEALLIRGRHNATNTLAAIALAQAIGLGMSALLHGLRDYRGEPHRVQSIAIIDGVEYIDDSKGTNVGATIAALNGLGAQANQLSQKKIILIAGGDGKQQNFAPLKEPIEQFVRQLVLIGKDAHFIELIMDGSQVPIYRADSLEDAVTYCAAIAKSGDCVLLSPACASFDMFKDYVHRAQVFTDAVEELTMQLPGVHV